MGNKSITFWDPSIKRLKYDVLLVSKDEVDLFDFARVEDEYVYEKVFVLQPNGTGYEDIFLYFIKYNYYPQDKYLVEYRNNNALCKRFLNTWDALVSSLNSQDTALAKQLLGDLYNLKLPIFYKSTFLLELLDEMIDSVIEPFIDGNIYNIADVATSNLWWRQPTQLRIAGNAALLSYFPPGKEISPTLSELVEQVKSILRKCNEFGNVKLERCLFLFSAYCYAVAEISFNKHRFNTALLLSYRALDLYFQSLAFKNGILQLGSELRYTNPVQDRAMVTMINSEYYLSQRAVLIPDTIRLTFIRWLNDRRKSHLLTHSVNFTTASDASKSLDDVKKTVHRIEGTTEWITLSRSYLKHQWLSRTLFFDLEDSLASYIAAV